MHSPTLTRRQLLHTALPAALSLGTGSRLLAQERDALPPVRTITQGPKFHWFGYYDKLEFDPTGRYVLGMEVGVEHRSPKAEDVIQVGMVDLHEGDRWIPLGQSRAWNWQQGCMLQWVPGSASTILWNDRDGDRFVCRILDVQTKKLRTIPAPIYTLRPDGQSAIAPDFRRLNDVRPGYGYAGIPDPSTEPAPRDSGLWTVNLATGKQELLFSVAEIAKFGDTTDDMKGAKHWFNHLLFNPDGTRFIFLHRWRPPGRNTGFRTRMFTAQADGTGLYVLDASGRTSHFIWRDARHVLAWSWPANQLAGFYLFTDQDKTIAPIGAGVMTQDGHCTYLPSKEWILNDTYPDKDRLQHVYLYHVKTGKRLRVGDFLSPKEYTGEWRCDTHPRFSPDGTKLVIDSPHTGGRQLHLIDISRIVG